jgi:ABC-2 type transport system ATP-binding protein
MSSDPAPLEARDVSKSFDGRPALDGVTLSISAGEILGLLGPNGAGKTTFVRSVVGRVRPQAGALSIFGRSPTDPASSRLRGWVPQEIALYPLLSPRENLYSFGRYQGVPERDLSDAAARSLDWAALSERADEKTERLSGGMKRRLNIAAGTIHGPRLLLLDEPTVGVDPQSRERIYGMIEELSGQGVAILYTTHYMEEAERLCDRIAIIDHGRIIASGTQDELVRETLGKARALSIESDARLPEALRRRLTERGATVAERGAVVPIEEPAREIPEVLELFRSEGVRVRDLTLKTASLESVFLQLTGRALRE